jgi:uridine kinase
VARIVDAIERRGDSRPKDKPLLVAIDGTSGAGKTTIARLVADAVGGAVVPGDDFFAAHITDAGWDARSPRERAADAIDWRRLRADALEPLLAGRPAAWHPFDFEAGTRPDGTYPISATLETRDPARVIVLDGAYSSRPELADLIDLSVLVHLPTDERTRRLGKRDDAAFSAAWHARWDAAEAYYFSEVRPPASFDLVIDMEPGPENATRRRS